MHSRLLNRILNRSASFDIILVSTPSAAQTPWWQQRLEACRGSILREDATILCLHEDWDGGAGNGLGTLYSLRQADERMGLLRRLEEGAKVALYHTAGKGTRLAPLPGAEGHNKPGVRLPGLVDIGGEPKPITLLEAVLRQTALYAEGREGRVSVFWGDQVFIPSVPPRAPTHHADILCRLRSFPDAATWEAEGLHQYGLIAVSDTQDAAQVEKIDHATARRLADHGQIPTHAIGTSLGSFSMSTQLTQALLKAFSSELDARTGKLDTDPHFWMPLTLDAETYADQRERRGVSREDALAHRERMLAIVAELEGPIFGAVDVGESAWWWDYGTLQNWWTNVRRLLDDDDEAIAMRRFYGAELSGDSIVLGGTATGSWTKSVLIDVHGDVQATQSVIVDSRGSTKAIRALVYGTDSATVTDGVVAKGQGPTMRTSLDRDGGADWNVRLAGNAMSYAEWYATRPKE